jgi:hypothetical protein
VEVGVRVCVGSGGNVTDFVGFEQAAKIASEKKIETIR